MIIEIRLLARLVRIPLLRVEGVVAIRDVEGTGPGARPGAERLRVADAGSITDAPGPRARSLRAGAPPSAAYGRDLAAAEAIMAELRAPDR